MPGGQPTRTRQKYKDSCTHCASAKVKCNKERPTCSRCSERKLDCYYGLSYRYGRLPARVKLGNVDEVEGACIPTTNWDARALFPTVTGITSPAIEPDHIQDPWLQESTSGIPLHNSFNLTANGGFDISYASTSCGIATTLRDTISMTMATLPSIAVETLPPAPIPDPMTTREVPFEIMNYPQYISSGIQPGEGHRHSPSVSSISSPPSAIDGQATAYSAPPSTFCTPPGTPSRASLHDDTSTHDCFPRATSILMALRGDTKLTRVPSYDLVNRIVQTIECECFNRDESLRILVVLIGFEVMSKYSRAAQDKVNAAAAELLIEDLRVVLNLMERLLRRLRKAATGDRTWSPTSAGYSSPVLPTSISLAVFSQLEVDLRTYLRAISNEATEGLYQG
ncbi:hypothetical protein F5Y15DRAFT_57984 [Xylariaceae sp. FL0016]|nr:hypothetical protein F5Y15DRAFT_57984 [Xylariaceae sp. FL0016]